MAQAVVVAVFLRHACISVIIDNYLEIRNIRNKYVVWYGECVYVCYHGDTKPAQLINRITNTMPLIITTNGNSTKITMTREKKNNKTKPNGRVKFVNINESRHMHFGGCDCLALDLDLDSCTFLLYEVKNLYSTEISCCRGIPITARQTNFFLHSRLCRRKSNIEIFRAAYCIWILSKSFVFFVSSRMLFMPNILNTYMGWRSVWAINKKWSGFCCWWCFYFSGWRTAYRHCLQHILYFPNGIQNSFEVGSPSVLCACLFHCIVLAFLYVKEL